MISAAIRGLLFLLVGAGAGYLAYMAGDRQPPVTVVAAWATNSPVHPGGTLKIHYRLIRYKFCPYSSTRAIVDSSNTRHILPVASDVTPFGHLGQDDYNLPVSVPGDIGKGVARYYSITEFYCNLLQNIWPVVMVNRPIEFIVR